MNIQIFGTNKCFDTKKAIRFFKERGVKSQFIDLKEKPMSKGELTSVIAGVGGIDNLIDQGCKDKNSLALIQHLTDDDKLEFCLTHQNIFVTPIVRNGKLATVGYEIDTWKKWE